MRKPWLILLVAWLGWVFDIMDTALFNFAKVPMLTEMMGAEGYKLNGAVVEGRIQMMFFFGWALGGLIFGVMADRWGRGKTMALTILLYCLFTGLTGLCQTPDQVTWIRFLTGIGIGGEWAAGAALVAESFTDRQRPFAAAVLQTAAAFGPWFAAFLNFKLADKPWQWLFYAGVAPAVIVVFIRFAVKDSDRPKATGAININPLKEVFARRDLRGRTILVLLIGMVGIAGATNAAFWVPNLVKQASEGLAEDVVRGRTTHITYIQHVGTLIGVFFFPWIAKRFGRRIAIGSGFALALTIFWFGLKSNPDFEALRLLAPSFSFAAIGVASVFGLYFPELFPSAVRATGAGLGYNAARILTAPAPLITGALIGAEKGDVRIGMALASLFYIFGLLILPFAPETKDKPLPE